VIEVSQSGTKRVFCVMSEEQRLEYGPFFREVSQAGLEFIHQSDPDDALEEVGELAPQIVLVGMAVGDREGLEFLAFMMRKHKDFKGRFIVLPNTDDPFPPMSQYKHPETGRSITEETDLDGVKRILLELAKSGRNEQTTIAAPPGPADLIAATPPPAAPSPSAQASPVAAPRIPSIPRAGAPRPKPTPLAAPVAGPPSPLEGLTAPAPPQTSESEATPEGKLDSLFEGLPSAEDKPNPGGLSLAERIDLRLGAVDSNAPGEPASELEPSDAPGAPAGSSDAPREQMPTPIATAGDYGAPQNASQPSPHFPAPSAAMETASSSTTTEPSSISVAPRGLSLESASNAETLDGAVNLLSQPKIKIALLALAVVLIALIAWAVSGSDEAAQAPKTTDATDEKARQTAPGSEEPSVLPTSGSPPDETGGEPSGPPPKEASPVAPIDGLLAGELVTLPLGYTKNRVDYTVTDPARLGELVTRAVEALKADPALALEIGGHTSQEDGSGANVSVGTNRALHVQKMFRDAGIAIERLPVRNYRATQPLEKAGAKDAQERNRRITIRLIK
jgi:hypothetical protein